MTIKVKHPNEEELRNFLLRTYLEDQIKKEAEEHNRKEIYNYKQRLLAVTPVLFRKFLAEKGVSFRCPSCGSDDLTVPESATMQTEKLPENFNSLSSTERGMIVDSLLHYYVSYVTWGEGSHVSHLRKSYYQVHCLNCGHLSLYRSVTVLNWLENLDKESEEE